jgi:hypothetical protein
MTVTPIFEPDKPDELLRGWLLHAHKGRDRHDLAARRCDQQRYFLGIPATITSAIVGTSTFAALQESTDLYTKMAIGALAIIAAILISLQSFLDLGARAERHRMAGAKYKATIRRMEQLGIGTLSDLQLNDPVVNELREKFDALEEEMPVVPPRIYDFVEAKYQDKAFVDSVLANRKPSCGPKGGA